MRENMEKDENQDDWLDNLSDGDQYLEKGLLKIKRVGSLLQVPKSAQKHAALLYRKASDAGLIVGRRRENMIAAVLYESCKHVEEPRTMEEICDAMDLATANRAKKAHLSLFRSLDIEHKTVGPGSFVPKFCGKLGVPDSVREIADDIVEEISQSDFKSERSDRTLSAAILYLACLKGKFSIRQKTIADVADVSRSSVSDAVQDLSESLR